MRLFRWLLAAFMVAQLVASCTVLMGGHAVIGGAGTTVDRPGTPVAWSSCKPGSLGDVTPLPNPECGMLAVPVDYAKSDGDVAQIAMVRFRATGDKIGSLVLNPGGPGSSGIEAAASLLGRMPPAVRERFDVVGFDPRGVGASTPAVWCNSDADNDRLRADTEGVEQSPAGVAHLESETKKFVERCLDKAGKEMLENVGTVSVVQDLDAMRAALGDKKLTFIGYSYGTRIGALYAEKYPQNVRAMILDGALDPNADPTEADIRQAAAFQKAFDNFAADCATDPACPLGTDPEKAVEVYHQLVNPLVENPAKTRDPRGLSYGDAVVGTILPLYSPTYWTVLKGGLAELGTGHGDGLLTLADLYMGRKDGHYDNSTDVRSAVNCVDRPVSKDPAVAVEKDRRIREVAPFMNYGEFTGHAPLSTCAFWPVPPTLHPHEIEVSGLPPMLVVSTTNDPATPYQAGVDLARQLGAALLTFEGTQHTVVFQGNQCVDDIAARYLIDLAVPPPGARCP